MSIQSVVTSSFSNGKMKQPRAEKVAWPIALRLYAIFGFLLALILAIAVTAYTRITALHSAEQEVASTVVEIRNFGEIETAVLEGLAAQASYVGAQQADALQEMADAQDAWNESLAVLHTLEIDEDCQANLAQLEDLLDKLVLGWNQSISLVERGDIQEAQRNHENVVAPITAEIVTLYDDQIETAFDNDIEMVSNIVNRSATNSTTLIIALGTGSVVIGLLGSVLISRSISNPINHLTKIAQAIADGDLEVEARISANDETGVLAKSFNQMTDRLRSLLRNEQRQREYLQSTVVYYGDILGKVAQGDLSARVTLDNREGSADDPLIVLGESLNEMTASLQQMIGQMRESAN